jgi:hypothetical protein
MAKKGKRKGKGKGKKKGKKAPRAPEPEPELEPMLRHAPPPSVVTSVLQLPSRCRAVICFASDGFLILAHPNGTCVAAESGEPYGQFAYRSAHTSGWVEVSARGEQQRAEADRWPSKQLVRAELRRAEKDAADLAAARAAIDAASKPKKGKGKGKGKKGKGKGKKGKVDTAPIVEQVQLPAPHSEYPELQPGWWGHGRHVLHDTPSNWVLGWHGGSSNLLELTHCDELADSQYRLTISAGGGAVFTGAHGGDAMMLLPMPAAEMIALSNIASNGIGTAAATRALVRFQAWDSLRPILSEQLRIKPPDTNPFSTAEEPSRPNLTRAGGADERTATLALARAALCHGDGVDAACSDGPANTKRLALKMADSVMVMTMLAWTDPAEHRRKQLQVNFLRWWQFRCDSLRMKRSTLLHSLLAANAPSDLVLAAAKVADSLAPELVDAKAREYMGRLTLPAQCGDWILLSWKDAFPDYNATTNLLLVHRRSQLQVALRPDSTGSFDVRLGPQSWAGSSSANSSGLSNIGPGTALAYFPGGEQPELSMVMPEIPPMAVPSSVEEDNWSGDASARTDSFAFDEEYLRMEILASAGDAAAATPASTKEVEEHGGAVCRQLPVGTVEKFGRWRLRRQQDNEHVQIQLWNLDASEALDSRVSAKQGLGQFAIWLSRDGTATYTTMEGKGVIIR